MHDDANHPATQQPPFAGGPPIVELAQYSKRSWWPLFAVLGVVGVLFVVGMLCGLYFLGGTLAGGGAAGRIAGRWVHVDQPPGRPAQALMSVGEVVSDRVYEFSRWGTVTVTRYGETEEGTWQVIQDINAAADEHTVLMQFPERLPERLHIRFIDSKNAEFRAPGQYGDTFYRP